MNWAYRIIKYEEGDFGLHEVYYEHGVAKYRTTRPMLVAESPMGVIEEAKNMVKSLEDGMVENKVLPDKFWEKKTCE